MGRRVRRRRRSLWRTAGDLLVVSVDACLSWCLGLNDPQEWKQLILRPALAYVMDLLSALPNLAQMGRLQSRISVLPVLPCTLSQRPPDGGVETRLAVEWAEGGIGVVEACTRAEPVGPTAQGQATLIEPTRQESAAGGSSLGCETRPSHSGPAQCSIAPTHEAWLSRQPR